MSRHRETGEKGCIADGIRWEGGEMKERHREFRTKMVCRGRDSIVRRASAAAIQGKLEKRVCRGWDERMKQGKNQEREQKKRNQKE